MIVRCGTDPDDIIFLNVSDSSSKFTRNVLFYIDTGYISPEHLASVVSDIQFNGTITRSVVITDEE